MSSWAGWYIDFKGYDGIAAAAQPAWQAEYLTVRYGHRPPTALGGLYMALLLYLFFGSAYLPGIPIVLVVVERQQEFLRWLAAIRGLRLLPWNRIR